MTAPSFVPSDPTHEPRDYESPVRRPDSWWADRPGELVGAPQPRGPLMGSPGPDIGYAVGLVKLFDDKLFLQPREHRRDADAGVVAVAMKRAAMYGRAPVVHDLTIGYTLFGFLDQSPAAELVAARRELFCEAGALHGYHQTRLVADAVPEATLRKSPAQIASEHRADWRSLLSL